MPSSTFENIFGDYNSVIDYKPSCRTIANKVNTLIEKPNNHMIKKVAIKDTGMSINGQSNGPISKKNG
jgi:hypothetical protein